MEHIKNVLMKTYEKKARTQEVLDCFSEALHACAGARGASESAAVAAYATPESYRGEVLVLSVPAKEYSPEISYIAEELRLILSKVTHKKISRIRFISR